ncbi:hypothetical protein NDU88_001399 [Pleurodeles waltl]|uniref:Uncharacterized protein n=1 Tax=Pleurodeles waltl TaxID=8319 RepID=A0AAV7SZT1_PLEWA|nr:hypothetical protein NDU88_001399 [Pleurodeles waltl]
MKKDLKRLHPKVNEVPEPRSVDIDEDDDNAIEGEVVRDATREILIETSEDMTRDTEDLTVAKHAATP